MSGLWLRMLGFKAHDIGFRVLTAFVKVVGLGRPNSEQTTQLQESGLGLT